MGEPAGVDTDGTAPSSQTRASIVDETGEVTAITHYAGAQHVLRIRAPRIAARCHPGQFVHLRCAPALMMRRPMSIMRTTGDTIEILFKVHGAGTRLLAERQVGEEISLLGPIGQAFKAAEYRRRTLLIGGGVGIPPMVFLADRLRGQAAQTFVIMGSEIPFPFSVVPSRILVPGVPAETIGTMPLLDDWGLACRLASRQGYAGCFDGLVTELAAHWIRHHNENEDCDIEIFACGPTPMLKAVAELAAHFALPCQISLEEFMACAVGGCAGCTVQVRTPDGPAMRRVCVDGPVFEAADVMFA